MIGTRQLPFSRETLIEKADFMETPPPKYFRLRPGGEVRLKYAYIIKCDEAVKDAHGNLIELRCTVDLESKSGGGDPEPQSQRNDSLGERGPCSRLGGAPLRSTLHRAGTGRRRKLPDHLNSKSLEIVQAKCEHR